MHTNLFTMMNLTRLKLAVLVAVLAVLPQFMQARYKATTVYMFGCVTSFNDSTIYFTPVQRIDSAYVDPRSTFLYKRDEYSNQLRSYAEAHIGVAPVCFIEFSAKEKDINKKLFQLQRRYSRKKDFFIKDIQASDFQFKAVKYDDNVMIVE